MSATQFPVVTICGSMRYQGEMMEAAKVLTGSGFIVLMPFVADYTNSKEADARKLMLDEMHLTKISMSEAIYVVGEHHGKSTMAEIQYAMDHEIEIRNWPMLCGPQ